MYLDGLNDWEDVPFRIEQGPLEATGTEGPVKRTANAPVTETDLDAMRAELEANPAARARR